MGKIRAERCSHNPVLSPNERLLWQAKAVFNASAIDLAMRLHFFIELNLKNKSLKVDPTEFQPLVMLKGIMSVKFPMLGNLLLHLKSGINMVVRIQE